MKFVRVGDYDYKAVKITQKELDSVRKDAKKKNSWMSLGRSCWECNKAHVYHIPSECYNCFSCMRMYHKGIDVTDYSDSELEKIAIKNLKK